MNKHVLTTNELTITSESHLNQEDMRKFFYTALGHNQQYEEESLQNENHKIIRNSVVFLNERL